MQTRLDNWKCTYIRLLTPRFQTADFNTAYHIFCIMVLSLRAVAARPLAHGALPGRPRVTNPQKANLSNNVGVVMSTQRIRSTICRADAGSVAEPEPTAIEKFADQLATLFPLWVFIGATIGIFRPEAVTWFSTQMFSTSLGFLMLCMGLTLSVADFKACARRPAPILVGYVAQYCIKPVLGFLIAKALSLPDALAVGLILVSCCPGGQASNVATFIAHGDVALSVLMTSASTIGAIVMTPLLTKVLAGMSPELPLMMRCTKCKTIPICKFWCKRVIFFS